ncbi:MAG: diadenylate cyclase CdaA [Oscillospiraceae bacterium]|jgi:diadenylate cyclase|nr:diadenylate cyclase CdaA [Oscillospiraceae bacterium]
METIREIIQNLSRYVTLVSIWDGVDILIMTVVIYKLMELLRRSSGVRVLKGIALLLAVSWVVQLSNLHMVSFVLANTMQIGLIALVVVFQPELRRMLEQMGSGNLTGLLVRESRGHLEGVIMQTVGACGTLSWRREGALIVFERGTLLDDVVKTGTLLNAEVTAELLKNVFFPKAPLHDGAVIIRQGRLAAAGCMLPLSNNQNLSRDLGMRHRAGIGMSENSDALVVIVSEESGSISVADGGMLKRHLDPETLGLLLKQELMPSEEEAPVRGVSGLWQRLMRKNS